jgi:hypothetical protein
MYTLEVNTVAQGLYEHMYYVLSEIDDTVSANRKHRNICCEEQAQLF